MKKKIANAIQLVLMVIVFVLLKLPSVRPLAAPPS